MTIANRPSQPGADNLALQPVSHNAAQGRWRTEAMRSHRTPRLMFLTRGQGRITIAGTTRGYGANNLIFIPARTLYGYEAGPTVHGHLLTIPGAMAAEWPEEPEHLRLRDVAAQKEAMALVDSLERELMVDRPGAARAAHYHLGLLAVFYRRQLDATPGDGAPRSDQTSQGRLAAAFTDLVERDYRRQPDIAEFARRLGVTPTHLSRVCRRTCGKSAHDLLTERVLYEARMLLRDTDAPVNRIAQDLGFNSPAYFTRAFQRSAGLAPTAFRKAGVPVTRRL